MAKFEIEYMSDHDDCETCGSNWAEGGTVVVDGELILDMTPHAHCFGGDHWPREAILLEILLHLGHEVIIDGRPAESTLEEDCK